MIRVTSYIPDADVTAMTPSQAAVAAILEAASDAASAASDAGASAGAASASADAADDSADAASLSATAASASATTAAASASLAEVAAQFAVALGRYHPTVAGGAAAVDEGDLFTSDELGDLVVYRATTGITPYEVVAIVGTPAELSLANGGTGAALTADPGALAYSGASALALLAPGAARLFLMSGGPGQPPQWAAPLAGPHFPILPAAGGYLNNGLATAAYSANALTADRIEFFPIVPSQDATIDQLSFNQTATGGAGTSLRMGIYADVDGAPGALLRDSGAMTTDGSGTRTAAIAALTLQRGTVYWGCIHAGGTPTVRCLPLSSLLPLPTNLGSEGSPHNAWRGSQAYGALPDPAGSLSLTAVNSTTVPFFRMRRTA